MKCHFVQKVYGKRFSGVNPVVLTSLPCGEGECLKMLQSWKNEFVWLRRKCLLSPIMSPIMLFRVMTWSPVISVTPTPHTPTSPIPPFKVKPIPTPTYTQPTHTPTPTHTHHPFPEFLLLVPTVAFTIPWRNTSLTPSLTGKSHAPPIVEISRFGCSNFHLAFISSIRRFTSHFEGTFTNWAFLCSEYAKK